jgi:hypothetical protein
LRQQGVRRPGAGDQDCFNVAATSKVIAASSQENIF